MKYVATREIFVPCSDRKEPLQYLRIKKGRVLDSEVILGKEVIPGTTTKIYFYLRTGALVKVQKEGKSNKATKITRVNRARRR